MLDGWVEQRGIHRCFIYLNYLLTVCFLAIHLIIICALNAYVFRRSCVGGFYMDKYLSCLLSEKHVKLQSTYKPREILELARDMKESMCYMSEIPVFEDDPRLYNFPKAQFEVGYLSLFNYYINFVQVLSWIIACITSSISFTSNSSSLSLSLYIYIYVYICIISR